MVTTLWKLSLHCHTWQCLPCHTYLVFQEISVIVCHDEYWEGLVSFWKYQLYFRRMINWSAWKLIHWSWFTHSTLSSNVCAGNWEIMVQDDFSRHACLMRYTVINSFIHKSWQLTVIHQLQNIIISKDKSHPASQLFQIFLWNNTTEFIILPACQMSWIWPLGYHPCHISPFIYVI